MNRQDKIDSLFYPLIEMESFNEQLIEKLSVKFGQLEKTIPGTKQGFGVLIQAMEQLGVEERAMVLMQLSEFYLYFISSKKVNVDSFKKSIDQKSRFGRLLFSYVDQYPEEFIDVNTKGESTK
ncbi:hypothetical protein ACTQ5K_08920 [Niallia sp. Sow4_A1]|uniref:hypothetical protein n=1 Tax=unclassified Niallia TaxID=2837522 RepID=UPI00203F0C06|nr:hypothetical protein [Niallia sp. MER TA 168]MCM3364726.1 hypothetical protein [Niallia sp. MER TA 168]